MLNFVVRAVETGRSPFPNPLEEPVLYARVERWVREGLEERALRSEIERQLKKKLEGGYAS